MARIRRANLNEQVYETLRLRLLRRTPGPGSKLSLHELAAELGVSRSPVHDALTRLVSEGLLSVQARRGYYVTPITEDTLRESYEVRLALELHAAARAVSRVAPEQLERFRELLDDAVVASEEQWDEANARFHECQVDLAGNALLSQLYRGLIVNRLLHVLGTGSDGGARFADEHTAIVEAFEAGDLDGARRAIDAHVASALRMALETLERAGGVL